MAENPFVGPRPLAKGDPIFGREREISEIYHLLGAERIVLLYSPSGAGKSSLVAAGLVPRLEEEFDVWGPARVNLTPPSNVAVSNRYVLSAAEGFEPEKAKRPLTALATMTLEQSLKTRATHPDALASKLLIFDQFEEILRVDPVDTTGKREFFRQVGEVLRDPHIWALFVLREDYLAPLDPYAPFLPTRFKNRYRIDLLEKKKAAGAILQLAPKFSPDAVEELVKDLATVQIQQPDGSFIAESGQYVEPLHLQVVCQRLWKSTEKLASICLADVKRAGEVTQALAGYYADAVKDVAGKDLQVERAVREWVGGRLITSTGIRDQVMRGKETSEGLANSYIDALVDRHILRQESRAGARWYELAHDRLLQPVQDNNREWFDEHLTSFQRVARVWDREGRNKDGLLLTGADLNEARQWAKAQSELTEAEREFLLASDRAFAVAEKERIDLEKEKARELEEREREKRQLEKEREQLRRNRWMRNVAIVAMIAAIAFGVTAYVKMKEADQSASEARNASEKAEASAKDAREKKDEADKSAADAREKKKQADDAGKEAQSARDEARRSAMVATANERAVYARQSLPLFTQRGLHLAALAYRAAPVPDALSGLHAAILGRRVERLLALGKPVSALSFLGARFAAVSLDGTFRLWDAASGDALDVLLQTPMTNATVTAFSRDGALLAAGDANGLVRVWDVSSGATRYEISTGQQKITALAFSPRNQTLATGSWNRSIRIWNGADGEDSGKRLGQVESNVRVLAFSDADTLIYGTGGYGDGTTAAVGSWNVRTAARSNLKRARYVVNGLATSDRGDIVTTHGDRLISTETNERESGHSFDVQAIAYARSSRRFATGGLDGFTKIWDNNQASFTLGERQSPVSAVAFSNDGQLLASGGPDGMIQLFRTNAGPTAEIVRKDLRNQGGEVWAVRFTPDGRLFATGVRNVGTVTLWDAETGEQKLAINAHRFWTGDINFTSDGNLMLTGGIGDATAKLWRLSAPRAPIFSMSHLGVVSPATFTPDEKLILTLSQDSHIKFWQQGNPNPAIDLVLKDTSAGGANGYAFIGKDRFLTQSWKTGLLTLWDLKTAKPIAEWLNGQGPSESLSMRPDGKYFITTGSNQSVKIWETNTRRSIDLEERAGFAAYSPDGKTFVTGGSEGTVRLWNSESHELLLEIPGHTNMVRMVAFSRDQKKLVSGSFDGTAQVYTLEPKRLLRIAKQHLVGTLSKAECEKFLRTSTCPDTRKILDELIAEADRKSQ